MRLEDICIYEYIKEYLDEISIVNYKKGQYINYASENLEDIFFILNGTVKVECITKYGKVFLVDDLTKNEFVGKISYMHDQNLFCDITATSNASLLKINKNTFKKLQKNPEFLKIFLIKTSNRIYYMYKKLMMKELFRLEEIFAYYILQNSENDVFKFKSMYNLCKVLSVSRKNLYNVINKFTNNGYIRKCDNSIIILDKSHLNEICSHVREFNEKNKSDLKLELNG